MKKIKLLFIFVLLISFSRVFGFAGHITTNTTWSTDIIITGDVWVDAGVTLTIMPGVHVYFTFIDMNLDGIGDTDFFINGRLFSQGMPTNKIYFTSNETNPQPGDWYGITYTTPDAGELSTLSNTEILYGYRPFYINGRNVTFNACRIAESATSGLFIESTIYTTTLNNSIIENCATYGLDIDDGTLIINDITIQNCGTYGFDITNAAVNLTNGIITQNGSYGLKVNSGAEIDATDLIVTSNLTDGIYLNTPTLAEFTDCRIASNEGYGIIVYNCDPLFTNCLIANNKNIGVKVFNAGSNPDFEYCCITDNYATGMIFMDGCTGTVSYSSIIDNGGTGISVIENSNPIINYNNIYNNCPIDSEYIGTTNLRTTTTGWSDLYIVQLPIIEGLTKCYVVRETGPSSGTVEIQDDESILLLTTPYFQYWTAPWSLWCDFQYSGSSSLKVKSMNNQDDFYVEIISFRDNRQHIQFTTSNITGVINAQNNWWGQVNGVNDCVFQNVAGTVAFDVLEVQEVATAGCTLPNSPPSLVLTAPTTYLIDPVDVSITWNASDEDNNAVISLYYDEGTNTNGTLITGGILEDDGTTSYLWDLIEVPDGTYHIYGVIDDGVNSPVVSYATGLVSVGPLEVSIPLDASGVPGTSVSIPVEALNTIEYYNILSYQFTVVYNTSILNATGVTTSGTLSDGWVVFNNLTVPGQIVVNGYGTSPLTNGGDLVIINFDVDPTAQNQSTSPLNFADFTFNEGSPAPTVNDGLFTVIEEYQISGTAEYFWNSNPIPGMQLSTNVSGSPLSVYTDINGYYEFPQIYSGSYTVTPIYNEAIPPMVITPYDASITSQFALFLYAFTTEQQIAADVSNDNNATVYDAALMAQYSVGLITSFPAGIWNIDPGPVVYTLNQNLTNQDYSLIAYGDPSGNWQYVSKGHEDVISVCHEVSKGEEFSIPIIVDAAFSSYYLDVNFDDELMDFVDITINDDILNFQSYENIESGRIRVGAFGIQEIMMSDTLITFNFSASEDITDECITISGLLDEEAITSISGVNGVDVLYKNNFSVDIYPNPAIAKINVQLNLHKSSNVSIKLFNLHGSELSNIAAIKLSKGNHILEIPTINYPEGIYFLVFMVDDVIISKKLILTK